jgi:hypothetical protein
MNARIRKKFLRSAERLFADACRLYATRPRGDEVDTKIEELSNSLLSLNLMLTFHQWSRHGPSRLRQMSVLDVKVEHIDHTADGIVLSGAVRWSRRHAGQETELTERFRIDCPVPSLRKTPRSVRPTIVLQVADGSAA